MRQERYKAILYSSDAKKIRDVVVPYMTDARMYKTKFCKTVKAEENDLVIKVDHHESNELLQIKNGDTLLLADKGALKSGKTLQMIVKKGDTATVEFPVKPQAMTMTGSIHAHRNSDDFKIENSTWSLIQETAQSAPIKIEARHESIMI